jgi:hypothetical protein
LLNITWKTYILLKTKIQLRSKPIYWKILSLVVDIFHLDCLTNFMLVMSLCFDNRQWIYWPVLVGVYLLLALVRTNFSIFNYNSNHSSSVGVFSNSFNNLLCWTRFWVNKHFLSPSCIITFKSISWQEKLTTISSVHI